jgi:adenosyl cobinamide kinase/adenosyl cobinamide phosphate guanylyltransferase
LVIGGYAAGKRAYVQAEYGYAESDLADAVLNERPVLYNLQALVAACRQDCRDLLPELAQKDVIICNEVGCGVVPLTPEDRAWREAVGRLCVDLAGLAERVIRISCGLPQVIKG